MDSFEELFSVVKEYCKTQMTEVAYKIWIKDIEAVSFDNDTVVLGVSSEFKKNIVTEKYKSLLSKGFEEALGFPVEINIVVVDEDPQKQPEPIPEVQGVKDVSPLLDSGDYDYTFDTFIVGSSLPTQQPLPLPPTTPVTITRCLSMATAALAKRICFLPL